MTGALLNPPPAPSVDPLPAIIGWRVGVSASAFRNFTFFDAIDKSAAIGIDLLEGHSGQKVSSEIPKFLNWDLTDAEVAAVRQQLEFRKVSMPAYYTRAIPTDPEGVARLGRFVKSLGIETVIAEPEPNTLADLDKVANDFGFNLAILNHGDPRNVMQALEGRSKRLGVCPDIGAWARGGINPLDGLRVVKDRLISLRLHDPSEFGAKGVDVPLGTGAAGIAEFLRELHRLGLKPTLLTIGYVENENPSAYVAKSKSFLLSKAIAPIVGEVMDETSKKSPTRTNVRPQARELIAAAVPKKASVKPRKPRKLLVVDLQAGYPGHASVHYANVAVELMAKSTGAFEAIFNNDLANLRYDKLKEYDALYLNNTVGPILNAPDLREGLLRYVREGGGLAGNHGTSRLSLDWPEFGELLGAHSGPHGDGNEKVMVKLDDPKSPINAMFGGKSFEFVDEYFRFPTPPYSREKLHILLSFDVAKTDMNQGKVCSNCAREDNDYAISWIRAYGKGRVFFTSFGNLPKVFWVPEILEHFLAGFQFVLGDLKADTTPSAQLASRSK